MKIPIGPHEYDLVLVRGLVEHPDGPAVAICDSDRQRILVSDTVPPWRRLSNFWHEVAHAWKRELDVHESSSLNDEPLANLIGLGMASMDLITIARIHVYLTQGIECDSVLVFPSLKHPVPVLRFTQEAAVASDGISSKV